eukprot:654662-Hanusia_phi.AAC.3
MSPEPSVGRRRVLSSRRIGLTVTRSDRTVRPQGRRAAPRGPRARPGPHDQSTPRSDGRRPPRPPRGRAACPGAASGRGPGDCRAQSTVARSCQLAMIDSGQLRRPCDRLRPGRPAEQGLDRTVHCQ